MATNPKPLTSKTPEAPQAGGSKNHMALEMALVLHQRPSLLDDGGRRVEGDDDDDFKNVEQEKYAITVPQQPMEEDAGQVEFVPLMMVRPESEETAQERHPAFHFDQPKITITYTRRGARPPGPKPSNSKIDGNSRYTKGENDNEFVPPTPTRKRVRPVGSKPAKSKIEQNPALFVSSRGRSIYIKRDKDYDFVPPTPTRKKARPVGSKSAKSKKGKDYNFQREDYIVRENTSNDGAQRIRSKACNDDDNHNIASKEVADGGIRFPDQDVDVNAMKSLVKNFKIIVGNGSVVGRRKLTDHLRLKYFKLCHARKELLHRHLQQRDPKLATRMIMEMVNIAEGIKAASSASHEDLVRWKKSLESFESLGMDVGFMRRRVDNILGLISAPDHPLEGYKELELERACSAWHVRALESRISVLKDTLKEMDVKMNEMVEVGEDKKVQTMRELANAPW